MTAALLAALLALQPGPGRFISMFDSHIEAQIQAAAERHDLPAELVRAIVQVESEADPFAARYEPNFRWTIPDAKRPPACSGDTDIALQCMSLGPMQVMGAVARELGYTDWLTGLCAWDTGLEYGCAHLARLRNRFLGMGWPAVVAAYNAGYPRQDAHGRFRNQGYVDKVAAALGGEWPRKEG